MAKSPFISSFELRQLRDMLDRVNMTLSENRVDEVRLKDLKLDIIDYTVTLGKTLAAEEKYASGTIPVSVFYNNADEFTKTAVNILSRNAIIAMEKSFEFNTEGFRTQLLKVIHRPGLITITPVINPGRNRREYVQLRVKIDMPTYGGDLEEYAQAVRAARSMLGYGEKLTGYMASQVWYRNLFGPARLGRIILYRTKAGLKQAPKLTERMIEFYWNIIRIRLTEMGNKAPFWRLLELGNVGVKLSSDKDGVPMPGWGPTHFVANSVTEIKSEIGTTYNQMLSTAVDEYAEKIDSTWSKLQELHRIKDMIDELIRDLNEVEDTYTYVPLTPTAPSKFTENARRVDLVSRNIEAKKERVLHKLMNVVTDIDRGTQAIERLEAKFNIILSQIMIGEFEQKRIYLVTYNGKEFRIRTKKLIAEIRAEMAREGMTYQGASSDLYAEYESIMKAAQQVLRRK